MTLKVNVELSLSLLFWLLSVEAASCQPGRVGIASRFLYLSPTPLYRFHSFLLLQLPATT